MRITTDAIDDESHYFDARYTCDADNSSPELRWNDPPEGTVGFALLAEDGSFTHWLIYNISAEIRHLPAGIPAQELLPNGIRQGVNGFGKLGYAGPCPPEGDRDHQYVFRLYALKALPELPPRSRREQVLEAILPLTIESCEVRGSYGRQQQKAG
jgi:Raf kinase inhibitor-like YbhB/YbcL family protein